MHFILSPYEEMYHHVREPMCGPCSFQHDKCQVGNMHISFGDFSSFIHHSIIILPPHLVVVIWTFMLPLPYMYLYQGERRILLKSVERELLR
jgi:hypothetical protein